MNFQSSLFKEISVEDIAQIFSASLGEEKIQEASLLKGGMFNTTYYVVYGFERKKAVLRLGPVNRHLLMGFERNLMNAEVYVCEKCQEQKIPCSKVLAYDTSKKIVDRDFMIVEYIPSIVMSEAGLRKPEKDRLYRKLGEYLYKLHQVEGEYFGFVSRIQEGIYFNDWSSALYYEVEDILKCLEKVNAFSKDEAAAVRAFYYENKKLLDEIHIPHLLHTDVWEGNVLLDEASHEIAAIIDGDRAVFGDIDFEFSAPWMEDPALTEGYGLNAEVSACEKRQKRRELYHLFYLLLEAYVGVGEYNNAEQYKESKKKVLEIII